MGFVNWKPQARPLVITQFRLIKPPKFSILGGFNPRLIVRSCGDMRYSSSYFEWSKFDTGEVMSMMIEPPGLPVMDEVHVQFYHDGSISSEKAFSFWFHTSFIGNDTNLR